MLLLIKNCLTNYVPKLVTYKPVAKKSQSESFLIPILHLKSNMLLESSSDSLKIQVSTTKHTSFLCKNFFTTFSPSFTDKSI